MNDKILLSKEEFLISKEEFLTCTCIKYLSRTGKRILFEFE